MQTRNSARMRLVIDRASAKKNATPMPAAVSDTTFARTASSAGAVSIGPPAEALARTGKDLKWGSDVVLRALALVLNACIYDAASLRRHRRRREPWWATS